MHGGGQFITIVFSQEAADEGGEVEEGAPSAEVGSITSRFESGEAFKSGGQHEGLDVDIKMAGKAREKFKSIEQAAQSNVPVPKSEHKPSKWDKKVESTAEVVNKRQVEEGSDEDDEEFDVKAMMNKFKSLGENASTPGTKVERKLEELEGLNVAAKNLRQRFEAAQGDEGEQGEEKKRQLEEEFAQLKEERDRAKQELEAEIEEKASTTAALKEEVQVAADHASKMTQKWEKIQAKEAKKAQKGQMPSK